MIRRREPPPANCARCPSTRQVPCAVADQCARGTEPHAIGRCGWFLAIAYAEPAGPAAPRTHDAPEGLC